MSAIAEPQTGTQAPVPEPKVESTINTKPADKKEEAKDCACPAEAPRRSRKDIVESESEDDWYVQRPQRRAPIRRYSPSPVRIHRLPPPAPVNTQLFSSAQLLAKAGNYDGIADIPYPGRSSVYLTTYPFTDRDVRKFAWLLSSGIEDSSVSDLGGDNDEYQPVGRVRRRERSPYYEPGTIDIPSVYLSRALDASVIPEDSTHNVRFLIVVQNRARPSGARLLVADSRKAAGIMLFYEALTGNSIAFVGAVLHSCKKLGRVKVKRVESLEDAVKLQEEGEGIVGVVC